MIDRQADLESCLRTFADLQGPKILIHGGGRRATQLSTTMGLVPQLIEGRRVTNADTLEVVTMVYAGLINKNMVAKLQSFDCNAAGFSGADLNLIQSTKRAPNPIDFGFVGDIESINTAAIMKLVRSGIVPVFCPLTHDGHGQLLNTNADTIASSIAVSLAAVTKVELRLCFEMGGVLTDPEDASSLQEKISPSDFQRLKSLGAIHSGMIPKLDNAFMAAEHGVEYVRIGSFTDLAESGTQVIYD